jgi:hypothetical protein
MDEKTHLDEYESYTPAQLRVLRQQERTRIFESSWQEQRQYLQDALNALGDSSEAREAHTNLAQLTPRIPDNSDFQTITDWNAPLETTHFTIGFDAQHGALTSVKDKATGHMWASDAHPLALFHYELFSQTEYDRFWNQYIVNTPETFPWAIRDYTKQGINQFVTQQRTWHPLVSSIARKQDETGTRFLVEMLMPSESATTYGAPGRLTLEIHAPHAKPILELSFQWFEKQACRLPEAIWLSFAPLAPDPDGWKMEKLGAWISPQEVVRNGNRRLHAVGKDIAYQDQFLLETLDAPLVAPGEPSLLNFTNDQPDLTHGVHINLFNNVWGTNFPMWYEEDARFRFVLHFTGSKGSQDA